MANHFRDILSNVRTLVASLAGDYCLLLDTWEGQPFESVAQAQALKDAGVAGVVVPARPAPPVAMVAPVW